jgi:capsule biosynthesis phosphatase
MRIVLDLDGVICELKKPNETYLEVKPNHDFILKMREWKKEGHYLIIHTGRHMKTCDGNVEEVIKKIGPATSEWLKKWDVPFDEIHYGKPYGDVYIDDLGITFSSVKQLEKKMKEIKPIFVIPMAGKGQRFKDEGILEPKFLVETKGRTLFEWSLEGLPLDIASKVIFVCLNEHEKKYNIKNFIRKNIEKKFPELNHEIIFLDKTTRGQVETVLHAKEHINNDSTLVIYNIDTYFLSTRLKSKLLTIKNTNIDGILGAFNSNDSKLSFIELDSEFVKRTKEKEPISDIASTGLYVFNHGKDFVDAAEFMLSSRLNTDNEYYVSELYNILIKRGKKFVIDLADNFSPLGTPDDIKKFEKV